MKPNKYQQLSHKEVIKQYQKVPVDLEIFLNIETNILVIKLKAEGRIEKYNIKKNALLHLKTIKVTSRVTRLAD